MRWIIILFLPVLFLTNLYINHFFGLSIRPFSYNFNLEQMVTTNPKNLAQINEYWKNDVITPFRIRNIFYGRWMVLRLWLDNLLKIVSPLYLVRFVGFGGLVLIIWQKPKLGEILWVLAIVSSSALGINIDTRNSLILASPVFLIWAVRSLKNLGVRNLWWLSNLLVIDFLNK